MPEPEDFGIQLIAVCPERAWGVLAFPIAVFAVFDCGHVVDNYDVVDAQVPIHLN